MNQRTKRLTRLVSLKKRMEGVEKQRLVDAQQVVAAAEAEVDRLKTELSSMAARVHGGLETAASDLAWRLEQVSRVATDLRGAGDKQNVAQEEEHAQRGKFIAVAQEVRAIDGLREKEVVLQRREQARRDQAAQDESARRIRRREP